jgi:hypothetical protein
MNNETKCLFDLVKQRYGDRLTRDELNEVLESVESFVKIAEELRLVKLENKNEPFSVFKPFSKEK